MGSNHGALSSTSPAADCNDDGDTVSAATEWIVLKQRRGGAEPAVYGPIEAPSAAEAIRRLAEGEGCSAWGREMAFRLGREPNYYLPTGRGRYHALPLQAWQAGTCDYTKTRGVEPVGAGA